jgi:hypothetical protein
MMTNHLAAVLLLAQKGNLWGPVSVLLIAGAGVAVVACLMIGGALVASSGADPDNYKEGMNWVKRGLRGGAVAFLATSVYQLFDWASS